MRTKVVGLASLLAALLVAAPARAAENMKDLVKVFTDSGETLQKRQAALGNAAILARNDAEKPRQEEFRKAILPLIREELVKKKADASFELMIKMALESCDPFAPLEDASGMAKPFLASECSTEIKRSAVRFIRQHGAKNVAKELMAIIQEPMQGSPRKNRDREQTEVQVINAAKKIPWQEAQLVFQAGAADSKFKLVRIVACSAIRDMLNQRPPGECDKEAAKKVLRELSQATQKDEDVSCHAALALLRFGSFEGLAEVMKRFEARGSSTTAYKTFCEAAHKPGGFLDVAPEKFNVVDAATRGTVIQAVKDWWGRMKDTSPQAGIFEALKAKGVQVPANLDGKDAIDALIEGLYLDERELRYESLDLLVQKTGNLELAKEFRLCKMKAGDLEINQNEPEEGYPPDSKQYKTLREQQKTRAGQWKDWWAKNKANARLVNGVWVTK